MHRLATKAKEIAPTTLPAMTPTFAELFLVDEGDGVENGEGEEGEGVEEGDGAEGDGVEE